MATWIGSDYVTSSSLCFAEFDVDPSGEIPQLTPPKNRVFANLSLWNNDDYDNWMALIPALNQRGYITRGYVLNDAQRWSIAIFARVNILATDMVRGRHGLNSVTSPSKN